MSSYRVAALVITSVACGHAPGVVLPATGTGRAPPVAESENDCPRLERVVRAAEADCPDASFGPAALAVPGARVLVEGCAARIDQLASSLRDPNLVGAAKYAAWATRVAAGREVEAIDAELTQSGETGGAAYTMALRQRRHAYFSAHDWCRTKSRPSPSEAWSTGFEGTLASLQPRFASCVAAAEEHLALVIPSDKRLTLHWKALIDPEGHPHEVAQVDFPSTLRADAGLCILDVIASTSFPAPGREVAVGSDVTFARHD